MQEGKGKHARKIRKDVVPAYWHVNDKIWMQVAVADHELRDLLKRSRQARKVVDIFSKNFSDEEVYEMPCSLLDDLVEKTGRSIRCLTKLRTNATERRQFKKYLGEDVAANSKRKKGRVDRSLIENLALSQKEPFQALVIQRQVNNCSLAAIRMVLGALVKVGKLRSIPKLGYVPANYDGDIKLTRKQHSRRK